MSENKQQYNLLHTREFNVEGEKYPKTVYTKIGRAWEIKGGFSIEIDAGLALTGRAVILPRKADEAEE